MIAGTAYAATDDTNVTIAGGPLTMSASPVGDFTGVTLTGVAQTTNATISPFTVTDARGSGAGWNVTVQATQFAEYLAGSYTGSGIVLATSSLTMGAPVPTGSGTLPTMTGGDPWTIDSGAAVKIASAAIGDCMGPYLFTSAANSYELSIPAFGVYATTYRSDVTVSAVTGP
jgi:hypothetical protein